MKRVALRRIVSKIASRRIETRRVASSVVVCHGGFKAELKLFDDYSSLPALPAVTVVIILRQNNLV